MKHRMSHDKR